MITQFKNTLRRFGRSTEGSTSVEAMIMFPVLATVFAATWVLFDMSRQQSVSLKANYTIGDIISRETEVLNDEYIDSIHNLMVFLTRAHDTGVDLRVTLVQYDEVDDSYDVVWSEARGDMSVLQTSDMAGYRDRLPMIANTDQLIIVETQDAYDPIFNLPGISAYDIASYSFTRPRFAPQIIFEGVNDGSGMVGTSGGEEGPETQS